MRKYFILPCIAVLVVLFASCDKSQSVSSILSEWKAENMNASLPRISLSTLDGEKISLPSLLEGKVGLIPMWRSGCGLCQKDLPKFMEMRRALSSNDKVAVVHISSDPEKAEARAFAKELNIKDVVFFDPRFDTLSATHLNTHGTPTLFIVDSQSTIIAKIVGLRKWNSKTIQNQMKALIEAL